MPWLHSICPVVCLWWWWIRCWQPPDCKTDEIGVLGYRDTPVPRQRAAAQHSLRHTTLRAHYENTTYSGKNEYLAERHMKRKASKISFSSIRLAAYTKHEYFICWISQLLCYSAASLGDINSSGSQITLLLWRQNPQNFFFSCKIKHPPTVFILQVCWYLTGALRSKASVSPDSCTRSPRNSGRQRRNWRVLFCQWQTCSGVESHSKQSLSIYWLEYQFLFLLSAFQGGSRRQWFGAPFHLCRPHKHPILSSLSKIPLWSARFQWDCSSLCLPRALSIGEAKK